MFISDWTFEQQEKQKQIVPERSARLSLDLWQKWFDQFFRNFRPFLDKKIFGQIFLIPFNQSTIEGWDFAKLERYSPGDWRCCNFSVVFVEVAENLAALSFVLLLKFGQNIEAMKDFCISPVQPFLYFLPELKTLSQQFACFVWTMFIEIFLYFT